MGARLHLAVPSWEGPTGPAPAGPFLWVGLQIGKTQNCPVVRQEDKPPAPPPDQRCPRGSIALAMQDDLGLLLGCP